MEVSHCPPIVGTHTPNRKRLDCGSFTGADMESSVHPGATPDSLKELWNSFERACLESVTEPPTDIVDRVAATLEDAISWLCSHSPQVFLPRHRGDSNCQGPKKQVVSTSPGLHPLPAGSPLTRPFTGSMDEIDPPLPEDPIWSRLYQSEQVPLKRENNQEPFETGGGPAPRENVHMERGFRKSMPVLRHSITHNSTTHNSGSPNAGPVAVSRSTASCYAVGESCEARHSGGSPILAGPNAGQVCSTGVEHPGWSPQNAACIVPQSGYQESGQRAGRLSRREGVDDYDNDMVNEEDVRGTRSANGRKRTCANRTVRFPRKKAKVEHTPEGLAERFGTSNRGALISTLKEEWQDITSQLLPDMDTTASIGISQRHDVPSFVNFVLQQGRLLERNSLRAEVQSLKNRIDLAHYYQLYVAASNDTRKGADSPFLAWMREWYRRRGRSPSLAMGKGKGASTVVKDCLVDLHLSDSRFQGVPRNFI
ncbi:uncharacterized protein PV06_11087 [Exophiala oligosperma]|uniref:Uncharacterized protein n=1 Tax=Exophiala oligosperma TaxID=215243 RepID=A0A0D2DLS2_9EURO|nr:uncharacterized protein PV06_11087 [Exophiala oligosperma]KIW36669.1 hypothetical protein PV06_11087 [Exophiala oligosperma]